MIPKVAPTVNLADKIIASDESINETKYKIKNIIIEIWKIDLETGVIPKKFSPCILSPLSKIKTLNKNVKEVIITYDINIVCNANHLNIKIRVLVIGFDNITKNVPSSTSSLNIVAPLNPAKIDINIEKKETTPATVAITADPYSVAAFAEFSLINPNGNQPPTIKPKTTVIPKITYVDGAFKYFTNVYL